MENIRTKKSVTTLLFDSLMLTIAWASFFFEETAGVWGKVIYAACFIFALIDVAQLQKIIRNLKKVDSVFEVKRLK